LKYLITNEMRGVVGGVRRLVLDERTRVKVKLSRRAAVESSLGVPFEVMARRDTNEVTRWKSKK
jgi:hypothetical protein